MPNGFADNLESEAVRCPDRIPDEGGHGVSERRHLSREHARLVLRPARPERQHLDAPRLVARAALDRSSPRSSRSRSRSLTPLRGRLAVVPVRGRLGLPDVPRADGLPDRHRLLRLLGALHGRRQAPRGPRRPRRVQLARLLQGQHRPQGDRDPVPGHDVRVLPDRRHARRGLPRAARVAHATRTSRATPTTA